MHEIWQTTYLEGWELDIGLNWKASQPPTNWPPVGCKVPALHRNCTGRLGMDLCFPRFDVFDMYVELDLWNECS